MEYVTKVEDLETCSTLRAFCSRSLMLKEVLQVQESESRNWSERSWKQVQVVAFSLVLCSRNLSEECRCLRNAPSDSCALSGTSHLAVPYTR